MSLIKYIDQQRSSARGPISFNRRGDLPFRGQHAMLREEEFEEYTDVVRDGYVELFDLSLPEHKQKLTEIVDAALNGWYSIHKMVEQLVPQPDGQLKAYVYCVWSEPFRELDKQRLPHGLLAPSQPPPG